MAKKQKSISDKEHENKIFAFIGSFFTIIGFLIILLVKRENKYAMFYAKQGLVLFLGFAIASAVSKIAIIGFIGDIFAILVLVLWILSWINALSGKEKNLFIVSDVADKIKI